MRKYPTIGALIGASLWAIAEFVPRPYNADIIMLCVFVGVGILAGVFIREIS